MTRRAAFTVLLIGFATSTAHAEESGDTNEDPPPATHRLGLSVEGGYGLGTVYDSAYQGAVMRLEVGSLRMATAENGARFIGGTARVLLGQTTDGFGAQDWALGAVFRWWFGRLSAGFGAHVAYVQIRRFTDGTVMQEYTPGLDGVVALDVIQLSDGHAIFVALEPSLDLALTIHAGNGTSPYYAAGGDLGAGFRW